MLKALSAKAHIAMGMAFLVSSIVLGASFLGLVPDRLAAVRDGRAALAEALAVSGAVIVNSGDPRLFESTLRMVVKRNPDLLSAGLRRADGALIVSAGQHGAWVQEKDTVQASGKEVRTVSTDTQVRLPLKAGDQRWGELELRFRPADHEGWLGMIDNPLTRLVAFTSLACFVLFYFYLGKALRQLDPSEAVPGRVRAALDTLVEGLLVIDRKQNIVLANAAFSSLVGTGSELLLGTNASRLPWLDGTGQPVARNGLPWQEALRTGVTPGELMMSLAGGDGQIRNFIVNCSLVLGARDKANGVFISLSDVTQIEQNKVELRGARDEAEAANRAKSEFLANMSHEIRTPMNAILGFTELLKRGYSKNPRDAEKFLDTIHSSGTHLLTLINDILDLSKVEAGQMEMELISCAPHRVVREVVEVLSSRAQDKGITLTIEVRGPIPATIQTDAGRLRQIVTNLVGNAIKFTERGSVRVALYLAAHGDSSQFAIDVIDSGIGIAHDKLDSIFEAFVQADTSVTRRFGGTGLGLSISRRFARALGGDIVASSITGAAEQTGSTFALRIDTGDLSGVMMLDPADIAAIDAAQRQALLGSPDAYWQFPPESSVLVVDDGPENRELIKLILEENGVRVEQAENGLIGYEMAMAGRFGVVLMDMQMPVLDGYQATARLREHGYTGPVIALTAHAMAGFEKDILAAGCTGFQTKPIDIDVLLATLGNVLGGQQLPGQRPWEQATGVAAGAHDSLPAVSSTAAAQGAPGVGSRPAAAPAAASPIVSRLADRPRLHSAIRKFTARLNDQLEAMERAWERREMNELSGLAHWLKGAAGTVGYDEFTEPSAELEDCIAAGDEQRIAAALAHLRSLQARIIEPGEVVA
ncbi:MAG: response regulator [Janthinobacterium lividum]